MSWWLRVSASGAAAVMTRPGPGRGLTAVSGAGAGIRWLWRRAASTRRIDPRDWYPSVMAGPAHPWGVCADGEFLCVEEFVGVPDTYALVQIPGLFSVSAEDDTFAQQQACAIVEDNVDVITVVATLGGDGWFGLPGEGGARADVDVGSCGGWIGVLAGEQERGAHFAQKQRGIGCHVDFQMELVAGEGSGRAGDQVDLCSVAAGEHVTGRGAGDAQ